MVCSPKAELSSPQFTTFSVVKWLPLDADFVMLYFCKKTKQKRKYSMSNVDVGTALTRDISYRDTLKWTCEVSAAATHILKYECEKRTSSI